MRDTTNFAQRKKLGYANGSGEKMKLDMKCNRRKRSRRAKDSLSTKKHEGIEVAKKSTK